jgi:hypothetical protein
VHDAVWDERHREVDSDAEGHHGGRDRHRAAQAVARETQRGDERKQREPCRHHHAREHAPVVEADFPKRPADRDTEQRKSEPRAGRSLTPEQSAGDEISDAGDDVVGGAAEQEQPQATTREKRADRRRGRGKHAAGQRSVAECSRSFAGQCRRQFHFGSHSIQAEDVRQPMADGCASRQRNV